MKALLFSLTLLLAGCSASPLSLLTGGGPNVAANVQAGKNNMQTVGESKVIEMRGPVARPESVETFEQHTKQSADEIRVQADRVEHVVVNEVPVWVVLFALLGWVLPTPGQIGSWILRKIFRFGNG